MKSRRKRWEDASDVPLTISTVLFLAAYALPILDPGLSLTWVLVCRWVVWASWGMLAADYVVRFSLSTNRRAFLAKTPFDLLVVILPLLRPLRLLRLVTLLSALNRYAGNSLRGKVGVYLLGSVSLIVFVASLAILDVERRAEGSIQSFGDALWWSITTITTVGYGDTYPVTTAGRFIAAGLMFAGIAVLGVVTASFASWLVERVAAIEEDSQAATRHDVAALAMEVKRLGDLLDSDRSGSVRSAYGAQTRR